MYDQIALPIDSGQGYLVVHIAGKGKKDAQKRPFYLFRRSFLMDTQPIRRFRMCIILCQRPDV